MKEYFIQAAQIINKNILLLLTLSIVTLLIIINQDPLYMNIQVLLMILIVPMIYARFFVLTVQRENQSYLALFIRYWVKYVIIYFILASPKFFLGPIVPRDSSYFWTGLLDLIPNLFAIYIFPFLFLKEDIFVAVKEGIKFLFKNYEDSAWLVIIVLFLFIFKSVFDLSSVYNIISLTIFAFIQNIFCAYLELLVFIVALKQLSK